MSIGKFTFQKFITRDDLRANPDTLYVFGDNMQRVGMGGQAGHMRGEPNAVGIPTKHAPGMKDEDFFSDADDENPKVTGAIFNGFAKLLAHMQLGKNVVYPEDGIGSGLSELPTRAPKIDKAIKWIVADLYSFANEDAK